MGRQESNSRIQMAIRDIIGILYCKDSQDVLSMMEPILSKDKSNLLKGWAKKWKNVKK